MREPKNQMLGTMEPPLMQLSVKHGPKLRNFILMQGTPRKNGSNQKLTLNLNE